MNEPARTPTLEAPFPWFGGKSRVGPQVWERFGKVDNYVEPFFGSGACLLARPDWTGDEVETVNDLDGFIANFWRSIKRAPDETAEWASDPVNENDLHARHAWLLERRGELQSRLEGDPEFYDARIAGWWCWGACCWIGSGWCSGEGPWRSVEVDGVRRLVRGGEGPGQSRQLLHLGSAGQGVHRKLPDVGSTGKGVHRQLDVRGWLAALSARLARVRVASGDWSRVCGPSPTLKLGMTAVFLDPPYPEGEGRYAVDSLSVAHDVRAWALEAGKHKLMRIALCGYEGEHDLPGWSVLEWKTKGGYGNGRGGQGELNRTRERIWFSPACLSARQGRLL